MLELINLINLPKNRYSKPPTPWAEPRATTTCTYIYYLPEYLPVFKAYNELPVYIIKKIPGRTQIF